MAEKISRKRHTGCANIDGSTTALIAAAITAGPAAAVALTLVPSGKPTGTAVGHGHGIGGH